jgi:hypothetical protein
MTYNEQIEEILENFEWERFLKLYHFDQGDTTFKRVFPDRVDSCRRLARELLESVAKRAPLGDEVAYTSTACLTAYNWHGRLRLCGEFCDWDTTE